MSLMKDRLRNLMRSAKNSIKDYSPAERRVRAATSNEPWPPSSRMMIVICRDMTDPTVYDSVLVMILKRLQDKGQVMHVRKSLQLVEFCLRHGNSRFVEDMKTRRYIFKGLQTYRFLVHGQDKGAEVRSKAERIMNLLADDSRLEQERLAAKRARSRMQGFSNAMVKNPPMNFAHRSESDETSSPSETRKERHPRETTLATLPSPSTQTSTSDDTSSSSFSDSTESKKGLKPLEPPRKKLTGKKAKAGISDSAASQNRGGHPAIPDNPFDPLSTMFDVKSADDRELFDWIPPSNENDHGNTASQAITKTAKANGGIVAALSHGGSDIKMGPPANVAATSLPMDIDSMLMTDVAVVPKQDAPFAHPEWYQIQPFRPMPMQHQHLPLYAHRVAPNRTVPFLALPPPTAQDSQNPFL